MPSRRRALLGLLPLALVATAAAQGAPPLVISELRWSGPGGADDEFVELYNASDAAHTVAGTGGGYAVAASDGAARCVVPSGTVIPARGHFLCVNAGGYSLAAYPSGSSTTATADATYTAGVPDNAGLALFDTAIAADFTLAHRLDAVGSAAEADALYREGAGLPPIAAPATNHAWQRDECGKDGAITTPGPCPAPRPNDTGDNAADFVFVDTAGTEAGGGQRLGAPGPQNLAGPVTEGSLADPTIAPALFDECVATGGVPNNVRWTEQEPGSNATWGTLDLRRRFTNRTGAPVTRLRFRIVDLTTYPAPSGVADVRLRTSGDIFLTVDRAPCGTGYSIVTVRGTTLETPPAQPHGAGFNATLSAGTVTPATPLADGASVNVRFFLGIEQTGALRIGVLAEAYPAGGALWFAEGTDLGIETDSGGPTTAIEPAPGPGAALFLTPPRPNPAAGAAELYVVAARGGHVTAALYDATGRRVAVLFDGEVAPGQPRALAVDGAALPPGVYAVRVDGDGLAGSRRLTIAR